MTADFTQGDELGDPSCGDAVRPEREAAAAEAAPAVGMFGALLGLWVGFKFLNET